MGDTSTDVNTQPSPYLDSGLLHADAFEKISTVTFLPRRLFSVEVLLLIPTVVSVVSRSVLTPRKSPEQPQLMGHESRFKSPGRRESGLRGRLWFCRRGEMSSCVSASKLSRQSPSWRQSRSPPRTRSRHTPTGRTSGSNYIQRLSSQSSCAKYQI